VSNDKESIALKELQLSKIKGFSDKLKAIRDVYKIIPKEIALANKKKNNLLKEVAKLEQGKSNLDYAIDKAHTELNALLEGHQKREQSLKDSENIASNKTLELNKLEIKLSEQLEDITKREGDIDRLISHNEEIKSHTVQIEKRIDQKKSDLTNTLQNIEVSRELEAKAKKNSEAAAEYLDGKRADLRVTEKERGDLKISQDRAATKYKNAEEIYAQAAQVRQEMKQKEDVLKRVEIRFKRDAVKLREERSNFEKQKAAFEAAKQQQGG